MDAIGSSVAVKKLSALIDPHGFHKELHCLMKVRHKNIVRFLGYCGDTQIEVAEYEGNSILADVPNLALCFEFVRNGLDKFIKGRIMLYIYIVHFCNFLSKVLSCRAKKSSKLHL